MNRRSYNDLPEDRPLVPERMGDLSRLVRTSMPLSASLDIQASGLSNAQIAEALIVSQLTVKAHLRSIYSKLGVTSRSAATRYALEHHLG